MDGENAEPSQGEAPIDAPPRQSEVPTDVPVWTRRERLAFSGSVPHTRCCLPLFLFGESGATTRENTKLPPFAIQEVDDSHAPCCFDCVYEALDHRLLWVLSAGTPASGSFKLLYKEPEPSLAVLLGEVEAEPVSSLPVDSRQDVLAVAENFDGSIEDVIARWELRAEKETWRQRMSIRSCSDVSAEACALGQDGQALVVDPAAGYIALIKTVPDRLSTDASRLHLRAHFFDHGQEHDAIGHWLGCATPIGIASVGLAFGIEGCYSFLGGGVPSGKSKEYVGWQRTFVDRSRGWHTFEIVFESGGMVISMDGEPVYCGPAEGSSDKEELWLVSRCGGEGVWANVELMHTPLGKNTWDLGVQDITPQRRGPWLIQAQNGRWQVDADGIMRSIKFSEGSIAHITPLKHRLVESFSRVKAKYQYKPKMDFMLGKKYRVIKVNEDGMVGLLSVDGSDGGFDNADPGIWWFPPIAAALAVVEGPNAQITIEKEPPEGSAPADAAPEPAPSPPPPPEDSPQEEEEAAAQANSSAEGMPMINGLAIECWSIPGEADRARVERVVGTFIEALQVAAVALPGNIHQIRQCDAVQHAGCFVYSFGTRRLHVATRATEAGRLLLVVRCGGGFIDFIEFARRHGNVELLRQQRSIAPPAAGGREVIRFTSVMAKGKVRAAPGPSPRLGGVRRAVSPHPGGVRRAASPNLASRSSASARAGVPARPGTAPGSSR